MKKTATIKAGEDVGRAEPSFLISHSSFSIGEMQICATIMGINVERSQKSKSRSIIYPTFMIPLNMCKGHSV